MLVANHYTGTIRSQRYLQGLDERQGWCRDLQVDVTLDLIFLHTYSSQVNSSQCVNAIYLCTSQSRPLLRIGGVSEP